MSHFLRHTHRTGAEVAKVRSYTVRKFDTGFLLCVGSLVMCSHVGHDDPVGAICCSVATRKIPKRDDYRKDVVEGLLAQLLPKRRKAKTRNA